MSFIKEDTRPVVVLDDVTNATFDFFTAQRGAGAPYFWLRQVGDFTLRNSATELNTRLFGIKQISIPAVAATTTTSSTATAPAAKP